LNACYSNARHIPIILAVKGITANETVETLWGYHQQIMDGLLERKIRVSLYACNGTDIKRGVQHRFVQESDHAVDDYVLPHPDGLSPPIVVPLPT
jgi:hypothetical protein